MKRKALSLATISSLLLTSLIFINKAEAAITSSEAVAEIVSTSNATSYSFSSFTPPTNSTLVVLAGVRGTTQVGSIQNISGTSLTWTKQTSITFGGGTHTVYAFWARTGSSTAASVYAVNVSGGANATGCIAYMFAFAGSDLTSSTPIRQHAINQATSTNPTVTFGSARSTSSGYAAAWFGALSSSNPANVSTAPTGWTEVGDNGFATPTTNGSGAYRAEGETSTSVSFTAASTAWGMIAVEVSVQPPPPPAAASNLILASHTTTSANLSWQDNSGNEDGFKVQRRLGDGTWTTVTTVAAATGSGSTVTYNDTQAEAITRNNPLAWRIVTTNAGGDAAASNIVQSTLPPSPLGTFSTSQVDVSPSATSLVRPMKNGHVFDPYGAKIVRVTDETTIYSAGTNYGYYDVFNVDNTRLLECNTLGQFKLHTWNPTTHQVTATIDLPNTPEGAPSASSGQYWHNTDADQLLVFSNNKAWIYSVSGGNYTEYANFALHITGNAVQIFADDAWDRFSFMDRTGGTENGAKVYDKSSDSIIFTDTDLAVGYDEAQIFRGGRYVFIQYGNAVGKVCDLDATPSVTCISIADVNNAPGHYDTYGDFIYAASNFDIGLYEYPGANPDAGKVRLYDFTPIQDYGAYHVTGRLNNPDWTTISFNNDHPNGVYNWEFVYFKTDGSGVRRMFQNQTRYSTYYDTARASPSKDGTHVAFGSNWRALRNLTCNVTAGNTTVTCSGANFTSFDVGGTFLISSLTPLARIIMSVTDANTVVVDTAWNPGGTGVTGELVSRRDLYVAVIEAPPSAPVTITPTRRRGRGRTSGRTSTN